MAARSRNAGQQPLVHQRQISLLYHKKYYSCYEINYMREAKYQKCKLQTEVPKYSYNLSYDLLRKIISFIKEEEVLKSKEEVSM